MGTLTVIGPGLHPDDLWRNLFWLRNRIEQLEKQVKRLEEASEVLTHEVDLLFGEKDS